MKAHVLQLLNGSTTEDTQAIRLQAGPLSLLYDNGTLRSICAGNTELVRQIYSAVRDRNWGTISGELKNIEMDIHQDRFSVQFESEHQQAEIHFRWRGHITGTVDGELRFEMDGEALSSFERNRIGFCILHPMHCAGSVCRIEQVDGQIIDSHFPQTIAPHQPFKSIRTIQHEYEPGQWVEVRMEGDTFEMEDQRNWIDASYKTYCTPLELPFPVRVETGTRIQQVITVRLLQPVEKSGSGTEQKIQVRSDDNVVSIPAIGLATASHGHALSEAACSRLSALNLSHLRVDLRLGQDNWRQQFDIQAHDAVCMGVPLELALHLGDDAQSQLQAVKQLIQEHDGEVARYLIFRDGEKSTRGQWVTLARSILGDAIPIVGGTDAFFTELNRERPEYDAMDGVVYSINPQVHAFDDASLVETLEAHTNTVQTARSFSGTKPIYVGPVTFKMRWNPNATAPQPPPGPGELPHQADPRQMSLFGAGWTLNSIKYLALGGASTLTYYETTGYMGIMATEPGSDLPDLFWNIPGGVYPMYHVFADFADFRGGELLALKSSDPLLVDGCVLRQGNRTRFLLTNLTREPQEIVVALNGTYQMRVLDQNNVELAMREPESYRAQAPTIVEAAQHGLHLSVSPFAVITLDQNA